MLYYFYAKTANKKTQGNMLKNGYTVNIYTHENYHFDSTIHLRRRKKKILFYCLQAARPKIPGKCNLFFFFLFFWLNLLNLLKVSCEKYV